MYWLEIITEAVAPLMSMSETLTVLNKLVDDGVIDTYALAGAVAAYCYIEPSLTEDLDVLIALDKVGASGLLTLEPILSALESMGYTDFRHEGIVIGDWPVQFLPVTGELDTEALRTAQITDVRFQGGVFKTRVLLPEYLVAKALEVGRPKDYTRIIQFVEDKAVDMNRLQDLLQRFGLEQKWQKFRRRMGILQDDEDKEEGIDE
jgi:hypothetical protein